MSFLSSLDALPRTGLSSGGAEATDFTSAVMSPFFRPRYLSRRACRSDCDDTRAKSPWNSARSRAMSASVVTLGAGFADLDGLGGARGLLGAHGARRRERLGRLGLCRD